MIRRPGHHRNLRAARYLLAYGQYRRDLAMIQDAEARIAKREVWQSRLTGRTFDDEQWIIKLRLRIAKRLLRFPGLANADADAGLADPDPESS